MANKNIKRNRRALKTRSRIELSENNRLTVFRSNSHIYAQVSNFDGSVREVDGENDDNNEGVVMPVFGLNIGIGFTF